MKKLISLISILLVTAPAVNLTKLSLEKNSTSKKANSEYEELEDNINNYLGEFFKDKEESFNEEVIRLIKTTIENILLEIKNNNVAIESVPDYLLNYDATLKKNYYKDTNIFKSQYEKEDLAPMGPALKTYGDYVELLESLKNNRSGFVAMIAAASVVAAGLYAAAFFTLGATTPYAISTTARAAASGFFLAEADSAIKKLETGNEDEMQIGVYIIKNALIGITASLTIATPLYPPAGVAAGIMGTILLLVQTLA